MNDWPTVTIGEVAHVITKGTTPTTGAGGFADSGINFVKVESVTESGQIDLQRVAFITEETHNKLRRSILQRNDLLFSIAGTIGRVARVVDTHLPANTNQALAIIRPNTDIVNVRFLMYVLRDNRNLQAALSRTVQSVQANLSLSQLSSMEFALPPLSIQTAIAEVLGALDDKIAANNKIARTIEALGSAKFTRVGLDVEPSNEVVLLGDIFDLNPRRTVASSSPTIIDMQALPTSVPLVERWTTGIRKGGTRFANGDTLIARITPCLENRKTAFVDFLKDGDVGIGSTEFIVMRSKNDLPLGLSYFMAISERFRDFAIQNLVGTSGRQRVSASDLARHTLSPVDNAELRAFGEWADANLKVLGSLRGENRTLTATRDALLPQLMSGKLRVKEAEEVVAAI